MSIRRYEPLTMLNEFNRLFDFPLRKFDLSDDNSNVETSNWAPAVDIKENANHFLIQADLPGVPKENIHISMENGVLTIQGEHQQEFKEKHETYTRIERTRGKFYRRFTLPETADASNIKANMKNGVLDIIIPKKEMAQAKEITIESDE